MRTIAALILSVLLAVMGYGIFWLICLAYTTDQMRDVMWESLNADMTYGTPQWVPDANHVTMDLPGLKLVMAEGPIKEIRAGNLRLMSGFLMRDRWSMQLPRLVEVTLRNGKNLMLESDNGELTWLREGNSLVLRAASVRLMDLQGRAIVQLGDVVLERKAFDSGVRLNLASRPHMANGQGVLTGQVVMPAVVFNRMIGLFGGDAMPQVSEVMRSMMTGMKEGGMLRFENVSFKMPTATGQKVSVALFGDIQLTVDGRMAGQLSVTSDNLSRLLGWVQQAGLVQPRASNETTGAMRFSRSVTAANATVRMQNMQSTLLLNGHPVGPLPDAMQVVTRLWPE